MNYPEYIKFTKNNSDTDYARYDYKLKKYARDGIIKQLKSNENNLTYLYLNTDSIKSTFDPKEINYFTSISAVSKEEYWSFVHEEERKIIKNKIDEYEYNLNYFYKVYNKTK